MAFHDNMRLFYERIFFPYLRKHIDDIECVVHLGDVFHDRRRIDTLSAKHSREYFFNDMHKILSENGKHMYIVCGNHDIYFKSDLNTNSLEEFITNQKFSSSDFMPFVPITNPVHIPKIKSLLIPWITDANRDIVMKTIQASNAKFAMAHLELVGFKFDKSQVSMHGDDPQSFSKFDKVFSGHYHYRHNKGNIFYLGSPTEQTWVDVDTKRGFHILDVDSGDVEFIENPYNIFENVKYGTPIDTTVNHPRYYRLYHDEDVKQSNVDAYVTKLYENNALAVDIRPTRANVSDQVKESADNEVIDAIEDTPTFIKKHVDDEEVAKILIDLYNKAINESE